jgi:transposase
MIQITPQMRIWLAVEPVDFRKGIDGLAQVCRQQLKIDPMAGVLVVFSSRRRKALKFLMYDGQGFWLCQKRLSHRAICLVADRCQTTDLRAGRPSTPVAALECQARQRPSCAAVAAYYAYGLTPGEFA